MLLWRSHCPGFLQNRLTLGYVIKYSFSQKTVRISNKFTKNVCDTCSNATKQKHETVFKNDLNRRINGID